MKTLLHKIKTLFVSEEVKKDDRRLITSDAVARYFEDVEILLKEV